MVLEKDAIAQDAPISSILRNGEIHDWALLPLGDGAQVQQQIYQELDLAGASTSAATANGDLSTDIGNVFSMMSTDMTALSGDLSGIVQDVLTLF